MSRETMSMRQFKELVKWAKDQGLSSFELQGHKAEFAPQQKQALPAPEQVKASPAQAFLDEIEADFEAEIRHLDETERAQRRRERLLYWSA